MARGQGCNQTPTPQPRGASGGQTLYHVSSTANRASILEHGLNPAFGEGVEAVFLDAETIVPRDGFDVWVVDARDLTVEDDPMRTLGDPAAEHWRAIYETIPPERLTLLSEQKSSPPAKTRPVHCPGSGSLVRGVFHYGTRATCTECGRTVGTRRFSALGHTAHLASHNQPLQ